MLNIKQLKGDEKMEDVLERIIQTILEEKKDEVFTKPLYCEDSEYVGFDMSGFEGSFAHKMRVLSLFDKVLVKRCDDNRSNTIILPFFWKGCGGLWELDLPLDEDNPTLKRVNIDISGRTTADIISKIIELKIKK